jgi:isopropylmalate/homocitrate/citramalate synthase
LRRAGDPIAKRLVAIAVKVSEIGIPQSEFQAYATVKYGKGFTSKEPLLVAIQQELDDLGKNNAQTVRAFMKAQIENAATPA